MGKRHASQYANFGWLLDGYKNSGDKEWYVYS